MGCNRLWLFAFFGMAYMLSCCMLVYVYESYFRSLVVGNEPSSSSSSSLVAVQSDLDRSIGSNRRTSTTTESLSLSVWTNDTVQRVTTCSLSNGTRLELPMAPDVILAGAMKSGTSYFWNLLRMHPDFVPSKKFEAHFFDWQFAVPPRDLDSNVFWQRFDAHATLREHAVCAARKKYLDDNFDSEKLLSSYSKQGRRKRKRQGQRRLTYEKTPNYMFLPQIPKLIMKICPWQPKIILILRNPVDRAYSHYVMDSDKDSVNLSFEEYIQLELETMRQYSLTHVPNISSTKWNQLEESSHGHLFRIPQNPHMTRAQHDHSNWMVYRQRHMRNYLQRGMYSVQLQRWMEYFPLNRSLIVLNNDQLLKEPRRVMEQVLTFLQAPRPQFFNDPSIQVTASASANGTGTDRKHDSRIKSMSGLLSIGGYAPMANSTRRFLELFYKPYNQQLEQLLGPEWKGIWDSNIS